MFFACQQALYRTFSSFWEDVLGGDVLTVADSEAVAEHVVRDSAQETAGQRCVSSSACAFGTRACTRSLTPPVLTLQTTTRVDTLEKGLEWLQLLKKGLDSASGDTRDVLSQGAERLGGVASLGLAIDTLTQLLNTSRGDMRMAVAAADPRLLLE
jgi:hypothetical protein